MKIATIFSQTGTLVTTQNPSKTTAAVRLAVDEINAKGGLLGKQLEVVQFDSASTALTARHAAQMAVQSRPLAVIGDSISALSLAVAPVLQEARLIMISPISTHPELTRVGEHIFRLCFLDSQQGKVMADFARDRLKAGRAALMTNLSSKYSEELSKHFAERFQARGGHIISQQNFTIDRANYSAQLEKIKQLRPDVLFIPGYAKESGLIMRQARAMGIEAVFLGGDGWGDSIENYAGPAAHGGYAIRHWHRDDPRHQSREFVRNFEAHHGPVPGNVEVLAYDAVYALADAVRRAGSFDTAQVRAALANTHKLMAAAGEINFDAERNAIKALVIVRHDAGGRTNYVSSILP